MFTLKKIKANHSNYQKYNLINEKKQIKNEIDDIIFSIKVESTNGGTGVHREYANNLNGMAIYFGVREYFINKGFFVDTTCQAKEDGKVALEIKW